jgi:opacity protein-like surface antigen
MRIMLYLHGDAAAPRAARSGGGTRVAVGGEPRAPQAAEAIGKEVSFMTLLRCFCLVFVAALLVPSAGQAEFEFSPQDWKVGLGLANPEEDFGWGLYLAGRVTLGYFTEELSLDGGAHYWKKSEDVGGGDVSIRDFALLAGVTYHLTVDNDALLPYLRGGLGMHFFSSEWPLGDDSDTDFGVYFGGGLDYQYSDTMLFGGEMLYHMADADAFAIGLNVTFLTDTY